MENATLKIDGMSCGHCVKQVTAALAKLPGVEVVGVQIGSAELRLDPALASVKTAVQAVTAAGYEASAGEAASPQGQGACGTGCCGSKVKLTTLGGRSHE